MQAVDELGYVPNMAARALVTRRTGAIALVISESEERIFGEPFFAGVVRGITTVVGEASRQLVLALVQTREQVDRLDTYLTPQHVDGVLHALGRTTPTRLPGLIQGPWAADRVRRPARAAWPTRATSTSTTPAGPGRPSRTWSTAGRRSSRHIAGPQDMIAGRDRLDGYRAALQARGPPRSTTRSSRSVTSARPSGAAAMRALLARRPDIDAVFAASDPMALGALRALREAGARCPATSRWSASTTARWPRCAEPPLTTVHQPHGADRPGDGHDAARPDRPGEARVDQHLVLDTELVQRASG